MFTKICPSIYLISAMPYIGVLRIFVYVGVVGLVKVFLLMMMENVFKQMVIIKKYIIFAHHYYY